MKKVKSYLVGQYIRFMLQSGGCGVGEIVEQFAKNKHCYRVKTKTGEFTVMAAEIVALISHEPTPSIAPNGASVLH